MDKTRIIKTSCDLCAPNACGMDVYVKNNKIIKIEGMKDHPNSEGVLCDKGKAAMEILYSPDRLKHPLKRKGKRGEGQWEIITWNEALDIVAKNLHSIKKSYGAESVVFLHGHNHAGEHSNYLRRLANLFGSPNITSPFEICFSPRYYAIPYTLGEIAAPHIRNSKCIIVWGHNPTNTSLPQEKKIIEAQEKGAKLIVVDPRKIKIAKTADIYAQIRPGTDGALALGILHVIIKECLYDSDFVEKWTIGFEELAEIVKKYSPKNVEEITSIPREVIESIAQTYAKIKPACILIGNAFDQNTNVFQAIRAINILMAITGNIDVKGGNVFGPSDPKTAKVGLSEKLPDEQNKKRLGADKYPICKLHKKAHIPSIWGAINTGKPYPVKAMFIMASNPLNVFANTKNVRKAISKLDFVVVADFFMTETAKFADIVLPACTFLEESYFVQPEYFRRPEFEPVVPRFIALRKKAVEPIGESWPDIKIITELGKRMGYRDYFPWNSMEEIVDNELKPLGFTFKDIAEHPNNILFYGEPLEYKKYEKDGFKTPSKKVEIYSKQLKDVGIDPLPVYKEPKESPITKPVLAEEYPLILTTGAKLPMYTHSQMRNIPKLRDLMPNNVVEINPKTAEKLKIEDNEVVLIESPRGSVECRIMITSDIGKGVVCMHHGFSEANPNVLLDQYECDPFTGSIGIKASLCRIKKRIW